MKDITKYTITVLQDLIKTCEDDYLLLEIVSLKAVDNELKSLFSAYADETKRHLNKLVIEIKRLGGCAELNKDDSESPIEFFNSSKFKESDNGMIVECLKKDDLILRKYFYALRKNIMWEVVPIVAQQYFESKNLHDQIENICMEKSNRLIHK